MTEALVIRYYCRLYAGVSSVFQQECVSFMALEMSSVWCKWRVDVGVRDETGGEIQQCEVQSGTLVGKVRE